MLRVFASPLARVPNIIRARAASFTRVTYRKMIIRRGERWRRDAPDDSGRLLPSRMERDVSAIQCRSLFLVRSLVLVRHGYFARRVKARR